MDSILKECSRRQPLGEIDLNIEYSQLPVNNCNVEGDDDDGEREDNDNRLSIDLNVDDSSSEYEDDHEAVSNNLNNDRNPTFDLNQPPPTDESNYEENTDTLNQSGQERPRKRCKNLNNFERHGIYDALLERSVNGQLKRDTTRIVAGMFNVSTRTVQRIWKMARENAKNGLVDLSHKRTQNCGRKRIEVDLDRIREIPLKQRTTLRSMACALEVGKTSLFRLLQSGLLRRHTNAIKSYLKEENKKTRLEFCLSMLDPASLPSDPIFLDMYNTVHIDEKLFCLTKRKENYYLVWDEEEPLSTCKSKQFIAKVMFIAVVARPRFDADGNEVFSGKIGIYPFITHEPAKRTSINRVAGTMETKPITSVGRDVVRSFLIDKVLPTIKEKWPRGEKGPIFIQQDNARTHIKAKANDPEFLVAASADGFDIRLTCQPANSPNLNVLDLGFFRAIQALQYKECPGNVDKLVAAVVRSFEDFSTIKSNRVFLTLQLCMIEIMKVRGSIKYRIPHVRKAIMEREGRLPIQFKCDATLVQEVLSHLG